jgi:four helix bundle protein
MASTEDRKKFRERIYRYALRLIKFVSKLPNDPVTLILKKQLTRSGTSVAANYFESIGASSKKDFQKYFIYALKSANETKFWLALIRDASLAPEGLKSDSDFLIEETKQLASILGSSIVTLKRHVS